MKKTVLLLALLVQSSLLLAQGSPVISIKQKSGNEIIIELSTNPVITFKGEEMVVTNTFTSISIPLGDIEAYTVGETTSIEGISSQPQYKDGCLYFSDLPEGTPVNVYSLSGVLVGRQVVSCDRSAKVSLDLLPKGVYVVNVLKNNIKITNNQNK